MADLLPANATAAERALSEAVSRISSVPIMAREVWNPDTIPASLLPWLAWAFGVDDWDTAWTDVQKRGAIKASVAVHRKKGTIGAVKTALAGLGFDVQVQEWFNQIPEGDPYTFRLLITADQTGASKNAFEKLFSVVETTKNLRSHLSDAQLIVKTQAGPYVAAAAGVGHNIHVTNYVKPLCVFNETTICM